MKSIVSSLVFFSALALFLFGSCKPSETHFLKDEKYREQVHLQFEKRKELAAGRSQELFSVFDKPDLTIEQREALEFLYAYMPLSDLADYDGDYFLGQVDAAFAARDYFDWGKTIPEDIFRHFVLVYRVNNENLDTARQVFFGELKDRVKGMTMEQAVLEVNHWCHEKVTYRGTDGRTSSPLALARTSWGRCGEESTFTTVALRAVGIPARQCYTPRWAHTDDNHAWVEAWVDGKWHYIGACEPEPELDVAWFTAPGKRAMMVHTNVFGAYNGPEEKNEETELYSVINLLGNYTTTREVKVKVVDESGKSVEGATVRYNVYNYAEFYPITTATTDAAGATSVLSGMGDVFVWVNKGDNYGYGKSATKDSEITIKLDQKAGKVFEETFVMEAPAEQPIKELSAEKIAENAKRLAHEDSIRNAYMGTFIAEDAARKFAAENNLNADEAWNYLSKSQGNWDEMKAFMLKEKANPYLFDFLAALREKDLRDTPADYLLDHLTNGEKLGVKEGTPKNMYASTIFSPRIALELIRPWRAFAQEQIPADWVAIAQANPVEIVNYVRDNIKISETENYYKCPISPRGSHELKIADKRSRDILFVALCRTMGIPSRLESSTSRPQYFENNQWKDVSFEAEAPVLPKASVVFTNYKDNIVKPAYSTHYTLAHFENGNFVTLNFGGDKTLKELPGKVTVDVGYYRLMIGSRANDGSVTVNTQYFAIEENETKSLEIKLPQVEGRIQVQGIVDPNTIISLTDGNKKTLKELMNGKGLILCFADPDKEPTKHILQDLPVVQTPLEEWGGGILFAIPNDKLSKAFDASVFKGLPKQSQWSVDDNRALLNAVAGALQIEFSNNFPLTVYLNSNGGILFSSQGYRIGIGENILKTIREEQSTK
ncbi:transglutaminase domain-containing protein [Dysgonomonas sp. ZJ279]|uniref:transglutaminase domain-containing protein n=1 Tax=Dysgonomonas sp. ZJ279 TaxID=2709796 RepID=UPI0013EB021A|nr:transglutaminase domain-containing protein [Dysgonomonas sp. ZJ279]